jgi:hypothetical protein
MPDNRITVYWTERHEKALQALYEQMRAAGIPCEYNGKPNVSAIIQYALEQATRKTKK